MKGIRNLLQMLKGLLGGAAGATGLFASGVLYGWFDYMAHPECFRGGIRPSPPGRPAPGGATVEPFEAVAGQGHGQMVLQFTAGEGGISEDGGIKLGLCRVAGLEDGVPVPEPSLFNGWGILQNTRGQLPNYFSCSVVSESPVRLEVQKKSVLPVRFFFRCCAREVMRHYGVKLDPLDYPFLYFEESKVKVRVRGSRLNEGDRITITLGDTRRGGPGWKVPAAEGETDLFVEVDERALGIYRPISVTPSISLTPKPETQKKIEKQKARRQKSITYSGRT